MTDTPGPTVRVFWHARWKCVCARENSKNSQPYLWQRTPKPHAGNLPCSIKQDSARRRSLIHSYGKPGTPFKTHRLAASAANTSGFVQTPQSKVPRNRCRAPLLLSLRGHFRLSHSVTRDQPQRVLCQHKLPERGLRGSHGSLLNVGSGKCSSKYVTWVQRVKPFKNVTFGCNASSHLRM